ncbi:glycosyltransferase [Methanoregula sp.]|uniref:glycosyltransferase n=1 Tax=Methanoregula sp. TaxID=2052170 RepID=UPI003563D7B8
MHAILALSFHPAFTPPKSGGEERLFYLLNGLSEYYDVTLVSFTYPNKENTVETVNHSPRFKEIRIPKTNISLFLHYIVNKCSPIKECSAVITSIESRFNKNFKKILKDELKNFDILMYESPFLFTTPARIFTGKKIVYNAYNNEYELMKPGFSNSILGVFLLKYVFNIEKKLVKNCDLIFVVSDDDQNSLIQTYNANPEKFSLVPNGIPVAEYNPIFYQRSGCKTPPICLFIGSYHPPNIEAVNQIVKMSALLPDVVFLIAGNVSQFFTNQEGLTERCVPKEIPLFGDFQDIRLIDGFYSLECWDTTPIVWTKPESKITVSQNIESLSIKLFSPHCQTIRVSGDSVQTIFSLGYGWNTLDILLSAQQETLVSLTCEKELTDPNRILGVAIQSIGYTKSGLKFNLDFNDSRNQISTFINSKNVYILGQISDKEKTEIFKIADIALNPMISGSGTNIKVLGYLSAGIPTITTPTGARGLNLIDREHVLICDLVEFPKKINELLADNYLAESLKQNGRKLVEEKFDWNTIVNDMSEKIARI